MTITTITLSSVDYTAYASVAEADVYLGADPYLSEGWADLGDDDKGRRLIAATRRLDLLPWAGQQAGGRTQVSTWPRAGLYYPDGAALPDDVLPIEIQTATILLSGDLEYDLSAIVRERPAIRSRRIGVRATEYFRTRRQSRTVRLIPGSILELVSHWLQSSLAAGIKVTGGEDADIFADRFEKETEGFA